MNYNNNYRGRGRGGSYSHSKNYRSQHTNVYNSQMNNRYNSNNCMPLLPVPNYRETSPRWQRPQPNTYNNWRSSSGQQRPQQYRSRLPPPPMPPPSLLSPPMISRPLSPLPGSEEARQKAIAEASARIKEQLNLDEGSIDKRKVETTPVRIEQPPPVQMITPEKPVPSTKPPEKIARRKNRRSTTCVQSTTTDVHELRKKILTQFTHMSKGKIQNLVNNPGSTRYDAALQHIIRDMRMHLSAELRNMYNRREGDSSKKSNEMIDRFNSIVPDLGIELVSLPDAMVEELSKILQLDTNDSLDEVVQSESSSTAHIEPTVESTPAAAPSVNVPVTDDCILVEPEDLFSQADQMLSDVNYLVDDDKGAEDDSLPADFNIFDMCENDDFLPENVDLLENPKLSDNWNLSSPLQDDQFDSSKIQNDETDFTSDLRKSHVFYQDTDVQNFNDSNEDFSSTNFSLGQFSSMPQFESSTRNDIAEEYDFTQESFFDNVSAEISSDFIVSKSNLPEDSEQEIRENNSILVNSESVPSINESKLVRNTDNLSSCSEVPKNNLSVSPVNIKDKQIPIVNLSDVPLPKDDKNVRESNENIVSPHNLKNEPQPNSVPQFASSVKKIENRITFGITPTNLNVFNKKTTSKPEMTKTVNNSNNVNTSEPTSTEQKDVDLDCIWLGTVSLTNKKSATSESSVTIKTSDTIKKNVASNNSVKLNVDRKPKTGKFSASKNEIRNRKIPSGSKCQVGGNSGGSSVSTEQLLTKKTAIASTSKAQTNSSEKVSTEQNSFNDDLKSTKVAMNKPIYTKNATPSSSTQDSTKSIDNKHTRLLNLLVQGRPKLDNKFIAPNQDSSYSKQISENLKKSVEIQPSKFNKLLSLDKRIKILQETHQAFRKNRNEYNKSKRFDKKRRREEKEKMKEKLKEICKKNGDYKPDYLEHKNNEVEESAPHNINTNQNRKRSGTDLSNISKLTEDYLKSFDTELVMQQSCSKTQSEISSNSSFSQKFERENPRTVIPEEFEFSLTGKKNDPDELLKYVNKECPDSLIPRQKNVVKNLLNIVDIETLDICKTNQWENDHPSREIIYSNASDLKSKPRWDVSESCSTENDSLSNSDFRNSSSNIMAEEIIKNKSEINESTQLEEDQRVKPVKLSEVAERVTNLSESQNQMNFNNIHTSLELYGDLSDIDDPLKRFINIDNPLVSNTFENSLNVEESVYNINVALNSNEQLNESNKLDSANSAIEENIQNKPADVENIFETATEPMKEHSPKINKSTIKETSPPTISQSIIEIELKPSEEESHSNTTPNKSDSKIQHLQPEMNFERNDETNIQSNDQVNDSKNTNEVTQENTLQSNLCDKNYFLNEIQKTDKPEIPITTAENKESEDKQQNTLQSNLCDKNDSLNEIQKTDKPEIPITTAENKESEDKQQNTLQSNLCDKNDSLNEIQKTDKPEIPITTAENKESEDKLSDEKKSNKSVSTSSKSSKEVTDIKKHSKRHHEDTSAEDQKKSKKHKSGSHKSSHESKESSKNRRSSSNSDIVEKIKQKSRDSKKSHSSRDRDSSRKNKTSTEKTPGSKSSTPSKHEEKSKVKHDKKQTVHSKHSDEARYVSKEVQTVVADVDKKHQETCTNEETATQTITRTQEFLIKRLMDIDLEIKKLMQEKWEIYKELQSPKEKEWRDTGIGTETSVSTAGTSTMDINLTLKSELDKEETSTTNNTRKRKVRKLNTETPGNQSVSKVISEPIIILETNSEPVVRKRIKLVQKPKEKRNRKKKKTIHLVKHSKIREMATVTSNKAKKAMKLLAKPTKVAIESSSDSESNLSLMKLNLRSEAKLNVSNEEKASTKTDNQDEKIFKSQDGTDATVISDNENENKTKKQNRCKLKEKEIVKQQETTGTGKNQSSTLNADVTTIAETVKVKNDTDNTGTEIPNVKKENINTTSDETREKEKLDSTAHTVQDLEKKSEIINDATKIREQVNNKIQNSDKNTSSLESNTTNDQVLLFPPKAEIIEITDEQNTETFDIAPVDTENVSKNIEVCESVTIEDNTSIQEVPKSNLTDSENVTTKVININVKNQPQLLDGENKLKEIVKNVTESTPVIEVRNRNSKKSNRKEIEVPELKKLKKTGAEVSNNSENQSNIDDIVTSKEVPLTVDSKCLKELEGTSKTENDTTNVSGETKSKDSKSTSPNELKTSEECIITLDENNEESDEIDGNSSVVLPDKELNLDSKSKDKVTLELNKNTSVENELVNTSEIPSKIVENELINEVTESESKQHQQNIVTSPCDTEGGFVGFNKLSTCSNSQETEMDKLKKLRKLENQIVSLTDNVLNIDNNTILNERITKTDNKAVKNTDKAASISTSDTGIVGVTKISRRSRSKDKESKKTDNQITVNIEKQVSDTQLEQISEQVEEKLPQCVNPSSSNMETETVGLKKVTRRSVSKEKETSETKRFKKADVKPVGNTETKPKNIGNVTPKEKSQNVLNKDTSVNETNISTRKCTRRFGPKENLVDERPERALDRRAISTRSKTLKEDKHTVGTEKSVEDVITRNTRRTVPAENVKEDSASESASSLTKPLETIKPRPKRRRKSNRSDVTDMSANSGTETVLSDSPLTPTPSPCLPVKPCFVHLQRIDVNACHLYVNTDILNTDNNTPTITEATVHKSDNKDSSETHVTFETDLRNRDEISNPPEIENQSNEVSAVVEDSVANKNDSNNATLAEELIIIDSDKSEVNDAKESEEVMEISDDEVEITSVNLSQKGVYNDIPEEGLFCVGHQKSILDIKLIGDEFLAASEDGTIYKYCLETGSLQDAYTGHKKAVTSMYITNGAIFNLSSILLYTSSLDCTLKCWNIDTAEVVDNVKVDQPIQCLDSAWGYIFLGTYNGHLYIYNIKKRRLNEESLTIASATVLMIKATREGSRQVLILASRKREIMVRDAFTGLLLRTMLQDQKPTIYSLYLDRNLVYCGTSDKGILVIDFNYGNQICTYTAGKGVVCMLMHGPLLFAGCYDGRIYVYDTRTKQEVSILHGPGEGMLLSLAITDQLIIAGTKKEHLLKIWKIPQEVLKAML